MCSNTLLVQLGTVTSLDIVAKGKENLVLLPRWNCGSPGFLTFFSLKINTKFFFKGSFSLVLCLQKYKLTENIFSFFLFGLFKFQYLMAHRINRPNYFFSPVFCACACTHTHAHTCTCDNCVKKHMRNGGLLYWYLLFTFLSPSKLLQNL